MWEKASAAKKTHPPTSQRRQPRHQPHHQLYIIPAGLRILAAMEYNASPRHDWLPAPPSIHESSHQSPSSRTRSSHSHRSSPLLSRHESLVGVRPDPKGFDSHSPLHYNAPVQHIHMGRRPVASGSVGGMSSLTFRGSGLAASVASIAGGSDSTGRMGGPLPPVPLDILSISTTVTPAPAFVPFAQPDAGSAVSILGDSSSMTPTPRAQAPSAAMPPILFIKDKASDLGIKDVTDKESWTEAKKIIDTRLR